MSDFDRSGGAWQRLSQVAVSGAEYDSYERLPHPKCLPGTRVKLLDHSYGFLDDREKSQIVWVHGTAGVGKSAVAFTVAERMRNLKTNEEKHNERRLAGTFFFSRGNANRSTTRYLFATLAYQLARNFPSVKDTLMEAIGNDPALLQPTKSPREQMEALFLLPLRRLQLRLQNNPPLVFVVDALDECTSEAEIPALISLLSQALRDPGIPVTHILVTSRSEAHVSKAIRDERVYSLVCEIPVKNSVDDGTCLISLDGADVDGDIVLFLKHSFADKQSSRPGFPQPTEQELWRLAKRAGRRFIIASTMMKFIDDDSEYRDPYDRLQLMLDLTCDLLPGTEVYELYNQILLTCTDPTRAYLHLSVVVALVNPLPVSQISELLGPGQGRDTEKLLVQLQSIMDVPTDDTLPVKIYHSSVRDYILEPSTRSRFERQDISPHTLLASSSLRLMMRVIPKNTGLQDALSELSKQRGTMHSEPPKNLGQSLAFTVEPPTAVGVLTALLWLRGDQRPELFSWLDEPDGHAWLQIYSGWLKYSDGKEWLETDGGRKWLETVNGRRWVQAWGSRWLETHSGQEWLKKDSMPESLDTNNGRKWLQTWRGSLWLKTVSGREWLETKSGREWLETDTDTWQWLVTDSGQRWPEANSGKRWLETSSGGWWLADSGQKWLETESGRRWLETDSGRKWLDNWSGQWWLVTDSGEKWLETNSGRGWLETNSGRWWLKTNSGREWLETNSGRRWLETDRGQEWLETWSGRMWLETNSGQGWLETWNGRVWLETDSGREWLEWLETNSDTWQWLVTDSGQRWLETDSGQRWLETRSGRGWLETDSGRGWLETDSGQGWLETNSGQGWLETDSGRGWLETDSGRGWLKTDSGGEWLETDSGRGWLETDSGRGWLETNSTSGRGWLDTDSGQRWLDTGSGRGWLETNSGRRWLETDSGGEWLETDSAREWLETHDAQEWLQTCAGQKWLQTDNLRLWLRSHSGMEWLKTPNGQVWRSTPAAYFSVQIHEFLDTVQAVNNFLITSQLSSHPTFQIIQQVKSLPDFLMFPTFLALSSNHPTSATSSYCPAIEIIHSMTAFVTSTDEARKRNRSASGALIYACQHWATHLSQAQNPWDQTLDHEFNHFWENYLSSWLESQWCLSGLQSCLTVLSRAQEFVKQKDKRARSDERLSPCKRARMDVNT